MTSLGDIRNALQSYLEQIPDLHAYDTWPGTVSPPAALVRPMSIEYGETFDGSATFRLEVLVVVRMTSLRSSQDELDAYISKSGPRSIPAALEALQSLGGLITSASVPRCHDYGSIEIGGAHYFGAVLDVEILD